MSECATVSFARPITAAAGVYAPGHIGELTQYLPFELVDDLLSQTKTVQHRLRVLPSRVGVYFVLALVLFPRLGYARVWQKLTAGLVGLDLPSPSEKALRDLRRRLGPAPFKALFEVVAGPLGQPRTPGVCYRGLRTVAFDGCNSLKVPDTERNRCWLGRIRYRMGFAGYPTIRLMALIETGTRAVLGALLGSAADRDEPTLARRLLILLRPGMLVLLDRAFDAAGFLTDLDGTGAKFLVRARSTRQPPVLALLPDGSFLSDLDGLAVCVIDAQLTVTGADGGVSACLCKQSRGESEQMADVNREPSTPFGEPAVSEAEAARAAVDSLVEAGVLDRVLEQVDAGELRLTGEGGFLPEMLKRALEAGLQAELSDHLGYERGDPAGRGSGNSRNGSTPKRLGTEVGDIDLATPRDRNGSFDPRLVGKGQRRLDGLSEMIISLYAKGMTVRDIQHHLQAPIGAELSAETISNITEAVAAEVRAWQARPLEPVYPIVYLDALVVKVRDGHQVRNKFAHIAVGVDCDGVKHVLGIWVQASEGAKFWAGVCAELANRGVRDVLIACCDGLSGFPEAIEATWPNAVVQTCTVHLIRAALRFVPDSDRKPVAATLRLIYTAPTVASAAQELDGFEESVWGKKYPAAVKVWRDAWERFIPFLEFPPPLRRIIGGFNRCSQHLDM